MPDHTILSHAAVTTVTEPAHSQPKWFALYDFPVLKMTSRMDFFPHARFALTRRTKKREIKESDSGPITPLLTPFYSSSPA